jgi:ABC-type nitrate/sulfonate/bicarbonate transport system permease component
MAARWKRARSVCDRATLPFKVSDWLLFAPGRGRDGVAAQHELTRSTVADTGAAPRAAAAAWVPPTPGFYRRHEPLFLGMLSVVALFVVWELSAQNRWVDPAFTSYPSAIALQFWSMYVTKGDIYPHLWASAQEAGIGFALSVIVGVAGGLVLGRMKRARYALEPYIMALYSTPTVAIFPLLILWFGIGLLPKVILIFLGGVFAVLVNTEAGVENADPRLRETAAAFRATEWQIFYKVMLPSSVPYILAGIRLAIGRVLIMMFVAELFISNKGLGFIVSEAGATFHADRLFVGVLTLTIVGLSLAQGLRYVEQHKFGYLHQD